jgi:hypothetical protein
VAAAQQPQVAGTDVLPLNLERVSAPRVTSHGPHRIQHSPKYGEENGVPCSVYGVHVCAAVMVHRKEYASHEVSFPTLVSNSGFLGIPAGR